MKAEENDCGMTEQKRDCCGLFDSHAHYFDRLLDEIGGADAVLNEKVFGAGVEAVVNVATNPDNAKLCLTQTKQYPRMFAAIGIHPEDCEQLPGSAEEELEKISALMDTPQKRKENKIVALGEIGLDYHWESYDKERQAQFFEGQLHLAEQWNVPVIIHDREAHGDCFETILRFPKVRGVFHSFSGSAEMAKELIRRGWYLSFSGVLTFKNARKVREVARTVPSDRILLETDAPYLSPEPFRGRVNHSGHLVFTAQMLAELLGTDYETAVRQTAENAKRFFSVSW